MVSLKGTSCVLLLLIYCFWHIPGGTGSRVARNGSHARGPISAEKRLIRRLMAHYEWMGRAGRPVRNSSMAVQVNFGLGLKQMDLNEKQKMLTMSMWTRYEWTDEYLTWDPEEYDGLAQLTVDPFDIWTPDIMLFNTADIDVPARSTLAVVTYSGLVNWFPHCIYHSACSVNVRNFPFDLQKCNLAFGSWTHPSRELDIVMSFPGGLDLSTFESENRESSAWDILNVTAKRQILPSETEYPNFSVLTFELVLSRKLVFSTYILTLPCVFLAFLTLVVFWLPPERPDRTALAMSTFSTFMFLLLILVESSPPAANTIPLLGVYYCINMVIIVMTVVLSTLVVNISKGPKDGKSRPPAWLCTVTLKGLARVFCMPSIYQEYTRRPVVRTATSGDVTDEKSSIFCWQETNRKNDCGVKNRTRGTRADNPASDSDLAVNCALVDPQLACNTGLAALKTEMELTRKSMERLEATLTKPTALKTQDVMWEWRAVAIVADRFFFALYIILIGLSLLLFFPRYESYNA